MIWGSRWRQNAVSDYHRDVCCVVKISSLIERTRRDVHSQGPPRVLSTALRVDQLRLLSMTGFRKAQTGEFRGTRRATQSGEANWLRSAMWSVDRAWHV